jgi:hypothetical protein
MEPYSTESPSVVEEQGVDTSGLVWFLKGFVFPCWSGSFYREATRRRLIMAILFFLLFGLLFSIYGTVSMALMFSDVRTEIVKAYQEGRIPDITIADGQATVEGPQPLVFVDDGRRLIAIDTSGTYREIDTSRYSEGILLTRDSLHSLSEEGYERIQLSQINDIFGSPIVLDREGVAEIWSTLASFLGILVFFGLMLWHGLLRFIHIMLFGLMVWGIIAMIPKQTDYGTILITGLYANVPAMYLYALLGLLQIRFLGLYSILLLAIWAFALRAVFRDQDGVETPMDEIAAA